MPALVERIATQGDTPVNSARIVRGLFLYSGIKSKGKLAETIARGCRAAGMRWEAREVDLTRGKISGKVLPRKTQAHILSEVIKGAYTIVVASPPGGTFSRARHKRGGPAPVRSKEHPRGHPWLKGRAKQATVDANCLLEFTVRVMSAQLQNVPGLALLEHPEDLGTVGGSTPASIWQLPEVRALGGGQGVMTGAYRHSDFGEDYQRPSRVLAKLPGICRHLKMGWPTFDEEGVYLGPLDRRQSMKRKLIGKAAGKTFSSAKAPAWPAGLCDLFAKLIVDAAAGPTESRTSAGGASQSGPAPPRAPLTPSRRKITPAELELLASGQQLGGSAVYVGRGGRGVPASRWGNPFKVSPECSRSEAVHKFSVYFKEAGLDEHLDELAGKVLLCHCGAQEECHADYLLSRLALVEPRAAGGTPAAPAPDPGPRSTGTPGTATDEAAVGWHGRGPSRCAQHIGGNKPFCDGGGLCSPGRWAPGKRNLPGNLANLKGELGRIFADAVARASGGRDDPLGFVLRLAAGRLKSCPFAEEDLVRARLAVQKAVGLPAAEDVVADGQVFHLRLISELLKFAGDPDWKYIEGLGDGVPLGVDVPIPRAPAIFEEKTRWSLPDAVGPESEAGGNYASVEPHLDAVKALFLAEAAAGWMEEIPVAVAKERYGERLAIASLGVVEEKEKIRVIHDASHKVQVNHRIRVQDQLRYPSAGDLRTIMRERLAAGGRSFGIVGDVHKAHRRIKIRPEDWGLQACQLVPETVWVNRVGTYGLASAAYYWSRFGAAALVRLCYYLAGPGEQIEVLLYVDDQLMLAKDKAGIVCCGYLLFTLVALGIPWRWDKFRGGTEVEWIGYWADLWRCQLGVSTKRAEWLIRWMDSQVAAGTTDLADFAAVLGRLCFAMGPLEYLRPFVAPLFAWSAAAGHAGRAPLSWAVAFLLRFLAGELASDGRVEQLRLVTTDLGLAFRADAKAEGQDVVVGGWECIGGTAPGAARWFSVELNRRNAAWAFTRGEPYRSIASLELFATLLCIMLFGDAWPAGAAGEVRLQGITDNAGNSFVVTRLMTTKFPLVMILAEVAAQLRLRGVALQLGWAPRAQNEEADALTNREFSGFDPSRRIKVDVGSLPFIVLPGLEKVASDLYEEVQARKAAGKAQPPPAPRRGKVSLKTREPWG